MASRARADPPRDSAWEVFLVFLRMGVTCFGGPVAHIGYFRDEIVLRRRWLSEQAYGDLVGLCQFLPGPASSKLGFSLGLLRAGYAGGLAAWVGFTTPSALLLLAFAWGAGALPHSALGMGLLHGLKLVAVAIVAQAVWGMARALCPDRTRASLATLALVLVLLLPGFDGQVGAIMLGGVLGMALCREGITPLPETLVLPVSRRAGALALALFAILLGLSFLPPGSGAMAVFAAFYRSGALVFGGGHVVLPLLNQAVVGPGWVPGAVFLNGYGAAQAVPGPLFTFATYLGTLASPVGGAPGAALATVAIFLPGLLLQLAALPFWGALRDRPATQAAMRGINAAVVGILGAALYTPVWTSAVGRPVDLAPVDLAVAFAGLILLVVWRWRPIWVVALMAGVGMAMALIP